MKSWNIATFGKFCFPILLLSLILIAGCAEEDLLETDPELLPYFEMFAEEGALRGIEVDYVAANIEGLTQEIAQPNVLGQCFRNEEKPRKVVVDINYWNSSSEYEKQFLIFHELGHCFLDRAHDDSVNPANNQCRSIMHSTPQACPFSLTEGNREAYLDELFGI